MPAVNLATILPGCRVSLRLGAKTIERFLFKKVELWAVVLVLILFATGSVAIGTMVHVTTAGNSRYGALGRVLVEAVKFPNQMADIAKQLIKGNKPAMRTGEKRFGNRTGFTFNYTPGSRPDLGYLVLSRYDADVERSVAELFDLNAQKTVHRWLPDYAEITRRSNLKGEADDHNGRDLPNRVRMLHPLILDDGSLIYKNNSSLVKVDACSQTNWIVDEHFHHSLERSSDANIWVPRHILEKTIPNVSADFKEDAVVKISPDGEILFDKSLPNILLENELGHLIYGLDFYTIDPTHLNDIQEVSFDSEYWKRGDIFLSIRNASMIALYRPSENKVIWHKQWGWVNQHDVDILDDHRISVFDNNMYNYDGFKRVNGHNEVKIYDFRTGEVTSPWKDAMKKADLRTITEGRSEILNENEVFIEESNYGRAVLIGKNGDIAWEYINRGSDGFLYILSWSRIIDRDAGSQLAESLQSESCG